MPQKFRFRSNNPFPVLSAEARLIAAEDIVDTEWSVTDPPTVNANPRAIESYRELGEIDASRPAADLHTGPHRPTHPSGPLVAHAARSPLAMIGTRFAMMRASYADGTFGIAMPLKVGAKQIVPRMIWLVFVLITLAIAAIVTEVVYGQAATALLTSADDRTALLAAITLSLSVNGASLVAGGWLHKTHPSIVRRQGGKVASTAAIMIAVVAVTLGLVVGGFDNLVIATATGGGATTVEVGTVPGRPLLTLTYTAILILVALAMAAGHLLIGDAYETNRVELTAQARADAQAASLGPEEAKSLLMNLGRAYLSVIPEAHRHGRQRVDTFNAAFRRAAGAELAELFADVVYDESEPAWAEDVRDMLDELDRHHGPSVITRIA
ncbi:MAG: hypothetical protein QM619_02150 [Micropruina sp.]|uniref:hypothetical protein n=1 Tax=Micropruina sp. TaxID=2737536 RepID=UPI0039E3DC6C